VDTQDSIEDITFFSYFNDLNCLETQLSKVTTPLVIMHQGIQGANMGHYVQDKSSLPPSAFGKARFISGHYHKKQDILLPGGGTFSYLGSPYTMNFGEANDGPKGFHILYEDLSLELVPLIGIRRHIVVERTVDTMGLPIEGLRSIDRLWLKVTGPSSQLVKVDKMLLGAYHLGHNNFKLDLIPDKTVAIPGIVTPIATKLTEAEMLDTMILDLKETDDHKSLLRQLWRASSNETPSRTLY
jgi:hypothetical protein